MAEFIQQIGVAPTPHRQQGMLVLRCLPPVSLIPAGPSLLSSPPEMPSAPSYTQLRVIPKPIKLTVIIDHHGWSAL